MNLKDEILNRLKANGGSMKAQALVNSLQPSGYTIEEVRAALKELVEEDQIIMGQPIAIGHTEVEGPDILLALGQS